MPSDFVVIPLEGGPRTRGLPDAVTLARLVSNVTEVVSATRFVPADDSARGQSICGRMVLLPIKGARDISVVLSCDSAGAQALASALCHCSRDQLTREMIDDAIAELLNMVAGQVQAELQIEQSLGLPRPTTLSELSQGGGVAFEDSVLLTSEGMGDLKLWVFERTVPAEGAPPMPGIGKGFRSLFRKLRPRR
jgi:chemotaxis phosphatase CheX-like protein